MRDSEVVASIVARDPEGLAEAYDRYAARIFSFCRSQLGEPADAAGAVQDTFVIAALAMSELFDRNRLRPWLYAVARNQCRRRLRAGGRPATHETGGPDAPADDVYDGARAQPLDLVRAAILSLNRDDQEVVELSLRHRLRGPDLADTLGVPRERADELVVRARGQLETSLGALVVARVGRKACPDLEQLLSGRNGSSAPRMRHQVSAHIAACPVCDERRRQVLGPVLRLGLAPLAPIPPELRDQVLQLAADPSPAATAQRDAIMARAGAFGAYGFPEVQAAGPGPWRRLTPRPMTAVAGAAATAAVAAVAAVLILVVPNSAHQPDSARPANLSSPVAAATPGGPGAQPTGTAGTAGAPASGARGNASTLRLQIGAGLIGTGPDRAATGVLAIQGGSLYALGGTENTGATGSGTSRAATRPPTRSSSPGKVTQSTGPAKTVGPIISTSPTPVLNPTPTASPTPTESPTPVASPTPSATPPAVSSSGPTTGATVSVSVGDLLSATVDLGN